MTPRFTVIIPSYNGGDYLKSAVASVLQQSFTDFELAVLDNCSEDGSAEWLASLGDARIKIYTSSVPLSMEDNWSRALEIPKNEFMTFIGHDDLVDSNYLEVMNRLICAEPEASLYYAHFRFIDKDGQLIRHCRSMPPRETAAEYIMALFSGARDTWGSGYVMRSALYDDVGGIPAHQKLLFADDALWIRLMHRSWKATAAEECFACRRHDESVGASADLAWIEGMQPYITFLEELSKQDAAVERAYATYGPGYFYGICRDTYIHGLNKATRNNQRFGRPSQTKIFRQLARVSQTYSNTLRHDRKVLLYKAINKNPLLRWLCWRYLRLRDGDG